MSILAECPICHKKQAIKNKRCKCGADLDKLKRQKEKVRYWIAFRLPGGQQRREPVSYSIQEARDADGKRRSQKREGRIFEMLPESNMTFAELIQWYSELNSVKKLASFPRIQIALEHFNQAFGGKTIIDLKPTDLENYQSTRMESGIKPITIDYELSIAKGMISKAFDNDLVNGRTLKVFRKVKKISTKAERSRTRTLTIQEYLNLLQVSPEHLKAILITLFHTGMRPGEVYRLQWKHIDRNIMFIRLPADFTKEKAAKSVPINRHVKAVLDSLPRHIDHDFICTYKGNPISQWGPTQAFYTACKTAGIPYGKSQHNGIVLHDFRRTFKTNCLKAGVDKVYRDTICGHTLRGMDVHYIQPSDEDLRTAMDLFTAWVDAQFASVDQSVDHLKAK
ncbi:MAG: site-specific integrase [Desulfobacterales bacterium]|nr:MAG: site-specific integrase [Desulfobacterales bacterium]